MESIKKYIKYNLKYTKLSNSLHGGVKGSYPIEKTSKEKKRVDQYKKIDKYIVRYMVPKNRFGSKTKIRHLFRKENYINIHEANKTIYNKKNNMYSTIVHGGRSNIVRSVRIKDNNVYVTFTKSNRNLRTSNGILLNMGLNFLDNNEYCSRVEMSPNFIKELILKINKREEIPSDEPKDIPLECTVNILLLIHLLTAGILQTYYRFFNDIYLYRYFMETFDNMKGLLLDPEIPKAKLYSSKSISSFINIANDNNIYSKEKIFVIKEMSIITFSDAEHITFFHDFEVELMKKFDVGKIVPCDPKSIYMEFANMTKKGYDEINKIVMDLILADCHTNKYEMQIKIYRRGMILDTMPHYDYSFLNSESMITQLEPQKIIYNFCDLYRGLYPIKDIYKNKKDGCLGSLIYSAQDDVENVVFNNPVYKTTSNVHNTIFHKLVQGDVLLEKYIKKTNLFELGSRDTIENIVFSNSFLIRQNYKEYRNNNIYFLLSCGGQLSTDLSMRIIGVEGHDDVRDAYIPGVTKLMRKSSDESQIIGPLETYDRSKEYSKFKSDVLFYGHLKYEKKLFIQLKGKGFHPY